jgi:hypothetical protein
LQSKTRINFRSFLSCIIICYSHVFAQNNWDNKYTTGFDNITSDRIIERNDSTFILNNYVQDSSRTFQDLNFLKLSKNGNLLINKTYRFAEKWMFINGGKDQFVQFSKGTCVMPSGFQIGQYLYGIRFFKLNQNTLDTILTKKYNPAWYVSPIMNAFHKLNENKYIFTGGNYDQQTPSKGAWPVVWHIDTNLNVTYKKNVINPNGFGPLHCAQNTKNKRIAIVGHSPAPKPYLGKIPTTILEYDTMGTAIRAVEIICDTMSFNVGRIFYNQIDSSYILIGYRDRAGYNVVQKKEAIAVVKLDAKTLLPIWANYYGLAIDTRYNYLTDLHFESNGDIVVAGVYNSGFWSALEDYRGIIMKLDKDGNFIWARDHNNYPNTQIQGTFNFGRINELFNSILKTKDKGFILGGSASWTPYANKAWVVKTDSNGCVTPACPSFTFTKNPFVVWQQTLSLANGTTGAEYDPDVYISENEKTKYQIGVYPNPFENKLSIEVINKTGLSFKLNNILGQTIIEGKLTEMENTFSTELLRHGIYILNVYDGTRQIHSRKVIKRD